MKKPSLRPAFLVLIPSLLLLTPSVDAASAALPAAPKLTVITAADGASVRLSWSAVPGAMGYEVLIRRGKDVPASTEPTTRTFLSANSRAMSNYAINPYQFSTYSIRAYNSAKEAGPESNLVSARGWERLAAPTGLYLQSYKPNTLKASWSRRDNAEYYLVYWNNLKCIGAPARSSGQDTSVERTEASLTVGSTFSVRAVNFAGDKGECASRAEKVQVIPPAPAGVSVSLNTAKKPVVYWKRVAGATSYRLSRIPEGGAPEYVATISENGRSPSYSLTDNGTLRYRTKYRYSVSTTSPGGTSPEAISPTSVLTPEAPTPRPLTAFRVSLTGTRATLTWTASPDTSNARIWRKVGSEARALLTEVTGASYADPGILPFDTDVTYFVRAFIDNKESTTEASQTIHVGSDTMADAPTGFAVKELVDDRLVLGWAMGARTTGIKLYRWQQGQNPTLIATLGNVTQFVDQGTLEPSSTYYYQAKSFNADGDGRPTPVLTMKTAAFRTIYSVRVSWAPSRESAVNGAGGGYRVLLAPGTTFDRSKARVVDVPYVSGNETPSSVTLPDVRKGEYRVRVEAYSTRLESVSTMSEDLVLKVPST